MDMGRGSGGVVNGDVMALPGDPDYVRGQLAFTAFFAAVPGETPPFDEIPENVRAAWIAAALAVAQDVLVRPPSDGAIPRPTVSDD